MSSQRDELVQVCVQDRTSNTAKLILADFLEEEGEAPEIIQVVRWFAEYDMATCGGEAPPQDLPSHDGERSRAWWLFNKVREIANGPDPDWPQWAFDVLGLKNPGYPLCNACPRGQKRQPATVKTPTGDRLCPSCDLKRTRDEEARQEQIMLDRLRSENQERDREVWGKVLRGQKV